MTARFSRPALACLAAALAAGCGGGGGGPTTPATPPAAPHTLTVVAHPDSAKVELLWVDASTDETSFDVERATGAGAPFAAVGSVGANVRRFTDTSVGFLVTYCYRVRATNAAGHSAYAAGSCVQTAPGPNVAPVLASATAHADSLVITLGWTHPYPDLATFVVERKAPGEASYTDHDTLPAGSLSYRDVGLAHTSDYCYRVRADVSGTSTSPSGVACATTLEPVARFVTPAWTSFPGDPLGALLLFERAIEIDSSLTDAWRGVGWSHLTAAALEPDQAGEAARADQAEAAFDTVLARAPGDLSALAGRAYAASVRGEALAVIERGGDFLAVGGAGSWTLGHGSSVGARGVRLVLAQAGLEIQDYEAVDAQLDVLLSGPGAPSWWPVDAQNALTWKVGGVQQYSYPEALAAALEYARLHL